MIVNLNGVVTTLNVAERPNLELNVPAENAEFGWDVEIVLNQEGRNKFLHDWNEVVTSIFAPNCTEVHLFWCTEEHNPWDCAFESDILGDGFIRSHRIIDSIIITDATEISETGRRIHK